MRFHIHTFGCRVNAAESDRLALELNRLGLNYVPIIEAELVVINSCAVTAKAVKEVRQLVRQVKAQNSTTQVIVTGCAATLWQKNRQTIPEVDQVVENTDKQLLAKIISRRYGLDGQSQLVKPVGKFLESSRLMVKVQDGCDYFCTFCIVPYLRGRSVTVPNREVVGYIQQMSHDLEINEAVLAGINLGLHTDFPELITKLLQETKLPKISYGSLYTENLTPNFLDLYKCADAYRLTRYFHVPLQSGNQKTLSLMRRRYTLPEFTERINALKEAVPDALIATDIIVGFLDETDADFAKTYQYLEESPITRAHIFKFSRREHTAAYFLAKRLTEPDGKVKHARSQALHQLFERKLGQFQQRLIGQNLRALILKERESDYLGFLDNGLEVIIPKTGSLPVGFANVRIDQIKKGKLLARLAA